MSASHGLVSVIMPVFNGGEFLPLALQSVSTQDYTDLEIIAIDDGSVDDSRQVLETFAASCAGRLKVVTHAGRQRQGIAASYRLGLQHCRGEYIAFLEQDDVWPTHKIAAQLRVFAALPEVGVVFSDVYPCDEAGRIAVQPYQPLVNRPPTERPFCAFWRLLWGNFVCTFSNFMVRSQHIHPDDIIAEPAGFQDWMLLLLLSRRCQFYYCNTTKTFWRQRPESYFAQLSQLPTVKRTRKLALKNVLDTMLSGSTSCRVYPFYTGPWARLSWDVLIAVLSALDSAVDRVRHSTGSVAEPPSPVLLAGSAVDAQHHGRHPGRAKSQPLLATHRSTLLLRNQEKDHSQGSL